jgi:IS30 family transposase
VGVSTSCGSLWFIDAGGVMIHDPGPASARFLDQDDRIAIADGLRAGVAVKQIAGTIATSFQTVYREIKRNSKPDGSYQPWWAHNHALHARKRPKTTKLNRDPGLRQVVRRKLDQHWSPAQISRFLARTYPDQPARQLCTETIYSGLFAGLLGCRTRSRTCGCCITAPPRSPNGAFQDTEPFPT